MSTFFDAWHYDGKSAVRRKVEVQTIGQQFFLLETERRHGPFSFADVEYVQHKGDCRCLWARWRRWLAADAVGAGAC